MKKSILTLCAAISVTTLMAAEAVLPDTTVVTGTLPNGLTYYVKRNNWPEHHADFFIAQRVGSIQETESQRGLAHFLEHMCFNGTKHFPGNKVIDYMKSIGVEFGANLNAYTAADETVYNICNVPTSRRSSLDSCLLVLSDWSHNLLLKNKDIDEERGVIEGEWRYRRSASNRMIEKALPQLYPGSLYGQRMPIGLMSVVKNFKYNELKDYYKKWYHPSNQAVIVVGDVDPKWVVSRIEALFGGFKNPKNAEPVLPVAVPDNDTLIVVVEGDAEQRSTSVRLMFKHDDLSDADRHTTAYYENDYLRTLATRMLKARFDDLLLQPDAPFTNVAVVDRNYMMSRTKQALQLMAVSKAGKAAQCVEWMEREVKRAAQHGFTQNEMDRARMDYESSLDKFIQNRDRYSNTNYARDLVRVFLDDDPNPSYDETYKIMRNTVENTQLQQVNDYIKKLVPQGEKNAVVAAFCATAGNDTMPTKQQLAEAFHAAQAAPVEAWVDSVKADKLLAKLPKAGSIVKEEDVPQFGAQAWTLSNGMKVWVKKTDFKTSTVMVGASAPGGLSINYAPEKAPSLKVINAVMAASGYGKFTASDLKKVLSGKQVKMRTFVSKTEQGFSGSATAGDLETLFQLIYLKITQPRKDARSFNQFIAAQKASIENQNAAPKFEFADSIFAYVYDHHPLGAERLSKDEVDKVNYDTIMNVYRDRFADVNGMNVYIAGNCNLDTLRALVCQYLASLPSHGRVEKPRDIGYHLFSGNPVVNFTRKMETPQSSIYYFWSGTCDYSLRSVVTARLLGQALSGIFLKAIREDRGWTYHVTTHCSVVPEMNAGANPVIYLPLNVTITAGHDAECRKVIDDIMADVAKNGVGEQRLADAKAYLKKVQGEDVVDNSYWQVMMKNWAKYGIDFNADYNKTIDGITNDDIARFVREHITHHLNINMNPAK